MDDQPKDDAKLEDIEDLEVDDDTSEEVRGGAAKKLDRDGVEAQHNETLLFS